MCDGKGSPVRGTSFDPDWPCWPDLFPRISDFTCVAEHDVNRLIEYTRCRVYERSLIVGSAKSRAIFHTAFDCSESGFNWRRRRFPKAKCLQDAVWVKVKNEVPGGRGFFSRSSTLDLPLRSLPCIPFWIDCPSLLSAAVGSTASVSEACTERVRTRPFHAAQRSARRSDAAGLASWIHTCSRPVVQCSRSPCDVLHAFRPATDPSFPRGSQQIPT